MNAFSKNEIAMLTDELGSLNAKLASFDELAKRRDEVRKLLCEHCDSLGDTETTLHGSAYTAVFSKPVINRSIEDVAGFMNAVGVESFLTAVKISTTAANRLLSKTDAARLFVESRGSRRLKAVVEVAQVTRPTSEQQAVENFYSSLAGIMGSVSPGFGQGSL